jgi:transposase InsO family protein
MEAIPLSDTSAAACAKALTFTWISCFGIPETITSDCGPQFTSNLWFKLCEMLHISHKQTTTYHPESNGAVKRLHRHVGCPSLMRRRGDLVQGVTFCAPRTPSTAEGRHWSFPS